MDTALVVGKNVWEQLLKYKKRGKDIEEFYKNEYENKFYYEFYCNSISNMGVPVPNCLYNYIKNSNGIVPITTKLLEPNKTYKIMHEELYEYVWIKTLTRDNDKIYIIHINPPKVLFYKNKYKTFDEYMKKHEKIEKRVDGTYFGKTTNKNGKFTHIYANKTFFKLKNNKGMYTCFKQDVDWDYTKKSNKLLDTLPTAIIKDGNWLDKKDIDNMDIYKALPDVWYFIIVGMIEGLTDNTLLTTVYYE